MFPILPAIAQQNTTVNRYATAADAAEWHNVNEGDYLIFSGPRVYHSATVNPLSLPLGGRILIFANAFERIYLDGTFCESTPENPTVITNFGGQARWGNAENSSQYRGLELVNFDYLRLTGKYDPDAQTGHPDFRGHDGGAAFGSGDYYLKYGLYGNHMWSGQRFDAGTGNIVRAYKFKRFQADYVAAWGGGFASFNVKTDNPEVPSTVEVDIQDCFTGLGEGEGFYISWSTGAENQDATRLTLRNNIIVFPGGDGLQTDNLAPGSLIENNVIIGAGSAYRHPFQAAFHDNAHQLSFVAGDVTVRNNLYYGAVGYLIAPRHKSTETGRFIPSADEPVLIQNNYFGYSQDRIGYVWQGDGVTPLKYINNVFGPINPELDDSYSTERDIPSYIVFGNDNTPITLENNIYPAGLGFYSFARGSGANLIVNEGNSESIAPEPVLVNLGFGDDFDVRDVTTYTAQYLNTPDGVKNGEAVPYQAEEIVITYNDQGETVFFRCLQNHTASASNHPLNSPSVWEQLTWGGRTTPPFDVRLASGNHYNIRKMGLTYNPPSGADRAPPVIILEDGTVSVRRGDPYAEPGYSAADNLDGDLTAAVVTSWQGPSFDSNVPGIYVLQYDVADSTGNVASTEIRVIIVYEPDSGAYTQEARINMHRYGQANLSDWTDLGNDAEGLRIGGATTVTTLYDVAGDPTGWTLTIDNINQGYSEHYKNHVNSAGVEIGEFPAAVTKQGLRLRDPHENPCVFVFTGLDAGKVYDATFTGYVEGEGDDLLSTLSEDGSGASHIINVRGNTTDIGSLSNLSADETGRLELVFSTTTPNGQPNIGGLILREQTIEQSEMPSIDAIDDQSVEHPSGLGSIQLEISDPDTPLDSLFIRAVSENETIIPSQALDIQRGEFIVLEFNTELVRFGTVRLQVVVSDGLNHSSQSFTVAVQNSNYLAWAQTYFGNAITDPPLEFIWGMYSDPDMDGWANWLEYLLVTDPRVSSPLPVLNLNVSSPGHLEFKFTSNPMAQTLDWDVRISQNSLSEWESAKHLLSGPELIEGNQEWSLTVPMEEVESIFFQFSL